MIDQLDTLEADALAGLEGVQHTAALETWRVAHLGRSSRLAGLLSELGRLPAEERPLAGQRGNLVKRTLEAAHAAKAEALRQAELQQGAAAGALDVSLPGRVRARGRLHPSTQTLRQIYAIWTEMGFQIYRSRDIETDEYNFGLLNIPAHHPARDMWDTFYTTTPNVIPRTHTSPGQIHAMRQFCPEPLRVILPGMCYRYEQITARSEIQFQQVEGLAVGRHVTMAELKGTCSDFARRLFGADVRTRFRPSYFPFTEPSAEMDVECFVCDSRGCPVCKYAGWLEILGCGMVHPVVLKNGGYDPRRFTGLAFGMGVQRITMLLHRIRDIRCFWANDVRFLEQF